MENWKMAKPDNLFRMI